MQLHQPFKPLNGESWVVTGTLETMGRDEATQKLQALGARVSGSVPVKPNVSLLVRKQEASWIKHKTGHSGDE
jgi:NAD-dependent DNA ligase